VSGLRGPLLTLLLGLGCAGPAFDAGSLAAAFPTLDGREARVLAQTRPYLLPSRGRVRWFLCRFDAGQPLAVSLPADAGARETRALEAALSALERSPLGLRFVRVPPEQADVVVELQAGPTGSAERAQTANTVADCRLGPGALADPGGVLPATLAFASVRIGRLGAPEERGPELDVAKLTGAVLHELGHALGFQGHVGRGESVMVRDFEVLRRFGAAALAGEPLEDPALEALYAVPSGAIVAEARVSSVRTQLVDRMERLAAGSGLEGPFARVGDDVARISWRDARGRDYGFQVGRLDTLLRDASTLVVLPEARARRALPREGDVPLSD
jgi:hypothetical protein